MVAWNTHSKQYVVAANKPVEYSAGVLFDIARFLCRVNAEHREVVRNA